MADLKTPTLDVKKASKKEVTRPRRTIRLEVKLFEPTSDSYPRINLRELKEKYLREHYPEDYADEKTISALDTGASCSALSFDDNDDVARMAKKFEEKYGAGSGYEMEDKGAGYDENDSFIDNTEPYDETLVSDTPFGGFYINSGPLKLPKQREVASQGGPNTSMEKNPGHKKRSMGSRSSIDSDGEDETSEKPTKKVKKSNVKKQKRKEVDEQQKPCKEIAIKDMLRFQRDNLLKTKTDAPKSNRNRIVSDDEDSDADSIALSETSNDSDVKIIDVPAIPLPRGLPFNIATKIGDFTENTKGKTAEQILANPHNYEILTEIEGFKDISLEQKASIKTYLISIAPCQELYRKLQKENPWEQNQNFESKMEVLPENNFGTKDQEILVQDQQPFNPSNFN